MKRYLSLLLLVGVILVAGCSSQSALIPAERNAEMVLPGTFPASAFQANAYYFATQPCFPPYHIPLSLPLGALGLTNEDVLNVLIGASIVNAACPFDVDVPEWDEWLRYTMMDVDVPEWDEWLVSMQDVDVPEWDEWLLSNPLDVDVPEWDEWLTRFGTMPQYRSANWMDWAVYGPYQIVDVDVPEWDMWLTNLRVGQIACSYDIWLHMGAPVQ